MARNRDADEDIVKLLREIEVRLASERDVPSMMLTMRSVRKPANSAASGSPEALRMSE